MRSELAALDLVGPAEIADRLGIRANTIAMWRTRYATRSPQFPCPEFTISRVPVWVWSDVLTWAIDAGRVIKSDAGDVTEADLELARELLPQVRAQTIAEVKGAAASCAHLLDVGLSAPPARRPRRVAGRFVSNDGDSNGIGEWDWYWHLSDAERARLRPHFSDSPTACGPDQWHAAMLAIVGPDFDAAMHAWARAATLQDAAYLLASRRPTVPTFTYAAATTYDPALIFGPNGAENLAAAWAEERARYEVTDADNLAPLAELDPADNF